MKNKKKEIFIVDSCVVIALLAKEKEANIIRDYLREAQEGKIVFCSPVLQYGEIIYNFLRILKTSYVDDVRAILADLPFEFIEIDQELALLAAKYKVNGKLSYADCYVLALAEKMKAKILTKDKEFKQFEKEIKVEWL